MGNIDWTTIEYSTEEQVVGKWINGELLYQKVIEIDNPTINQTSDYIHNIDNVSYGFISEMFLRKNGTNECRSINYFLSITEWCVAQFSPKKISYRIPISQWSWDASASYSLFIVVSYIKTSD